MTEASALIDAAGDDDLIGEPATRYAEIETELDKLKTRRDRIEMLARHMPAGTSGDGATGLQGFSHNRQADPYDMADVRYHGADVKARALTSVDQTRGLADDYKARATELLESIDTEGGALARHIVVTGRTGVIPVGLPEARCRPGVGAHR